MITPFPTILQRRDLVMWLWFYNEYLIPALNLELISFRPNVLSRLRIYFSKQEESSFHKYNHIVDIVSSSFEFARTAPPTGAPGGKGGFQGVSPWESIKFSIQIRACEDCLSGRNPRRALGEPRKEKGGFRGSPPENQLNTILYICWIIVIFSECVDLLEFLGLGKLTTTGSLRPSTYLLTVFSVVVVHAASLIKDDDSWEEWKGRVSEGERG